MNIFISFKYTITLDGKTKADEGFRSEVFEDIDSPYNEVSLRDMEQRVKDFLLHGINDEKAAAFVTILNWKELGSFEEVQFEKYIIAPTSFQMDHQDDDPVYNQNLFGYVGKRIPRSGDFVLQRSCTTMYESSGKGNDEEEVWELIPADSISKVFYSRDESK